MSEEKIVHVQEGHNPWPAVQAFGEVLERGHNGQPLVQAFAQLTQPGNSGPTPTARPASTPPSPPAGRAANKA